MSDQDLRENKHFERPTTLRPDFPVVRRLSYLIIIAVIGLLTGALGTSVMLTYIFPLTEFQRLTPSFIDTETIRINSEQPLIGLAQVVENSVVEVMRHKVRSDDLFSKLPDPQDFISTGIVVTSDGWIVTDTSVKGVASQYDVLVNGQYYQAQDRVSDIFTGISFLKIETQNLKPAAFEEVLPTTGELLISVDIDTVGQTQFSTTYVQQSNYLPVVTKTDLVRSSDTLNNYIRPSEPPTQGYNFSYFNLSGRLVGLMTSDSSPDMIIPARQIKLSLEAMLSAQVEKRLGIFYIEPLRNVRTAPSHGVVLYHPTKLAIVPNSLAARAGLQVNDHLISMNGERVDLTNLGYIWRKHQYDESLRFSIIRDGKEGIIAFPNQE